VFEEAGDTTVVSPDAIDVPLQDAELNQLKM
jgi:hypothetical protein